MRRVNVLKFGGRSAAQAIRCGHHHHPRVRGLLLGGRGGADGSHAGTGERLPEPGQEAAQGAEGAAGLPRLQKDHRRLSG